MKTRKIGRILTVMFLSGGLITGCQKKQTVVLPEKEQKEEATKTESKNKATQEISFDEELPKDYEGTLTIPQVNPDLCVGCGGCESICPVRPMRAIIVKSNVVHQTIVLPEEEEVKNVEVDDFGF